MTDPLFLSILVVMTVSSTTCCTLAASCHPTYHAVFPVYMTVLAQKHCLMYEL